MRINSVKQKLERGETSVGTMMMEFATTGIARLAAAAGAEFAVFDMEHTGWSMETTRMLMATSRAAQLVPLVRPPAGEYHFIARVLDMGAMGVVTPLVSTVEQARQNVAAAKYPPAGRRGCAFGVAHDDYAMGDVAETMRSANEQILVIAQIETAEGLENVERIAAVEGVDALWIGQFDLTASLGVPGQFQHAKFRNARDRILRACQSAGKAAGYGSLALEELCQARDDGFRLLVYVADLWIYQRALGEGLQQIKAARNS